MVICHGSQRFELLEGLHLPLVLIDSFTFSHAEDMSGPPRLPDHRHRKQAPSPLAKYSVAVAVKGKGADVR